MAGKPNNAQLKRGSYAGSRFAHSKGKDGVLSAKSRQGANSVTKKPSGKSNARVSTKGNAKGDANGAVKVKGQDRNSKPNAKQPAKTRVCQAPRSAFLPVNMDDARARGWNQVDFAYVCGDAYVDQSSFGMAIISRVLESHGYKVGIIAQPDWRDPESINVFGKPRLGFIVSSGNMDSMVNHYTVNKVPRSSDAYSPGGKAGCRPNHAVVVYGNLIRRMYKTTPIIIGGIEASLRRLAHYDYWSDSLKRSILLDSGADLISYGMGERSIVCLLYTSPSPRDS